MGIFQIIGIVLGIPAVAQVVYSIYYLIKNPPWFTVEEQQEVVIQRLGKFKRVYGPGMHLIIPGYHKKRKITEGGQVFDYVDRRERAVDLPKQIVITKDNVTMEINALLYYQVTDPKRALYEVANLPQAIEKLTQTTLRNVIGAMDLDETLSSRDRINEKLRLILGSKYLMLEKRLDHHRRRECVSV